MRLTRKGADRGGTGALLAGLALAGVFGVVAWVRAVEPLGLDQGLFALFGHLVPQGWVPYRDLWDSKPPLALLTYPLAFALCGEGVIGLWRFESLWLGLTAAAAYGTARTVGGRWAGFLAAAFTLAGMWSPGWGGYWARAQAEEFLALPLLGAAYAAWLARRHPNAAFGCGLLTGIAGLYKVPALALLAAWPWPWLAARREGTWLRRILLMAAGAVLPWVVVLAWFWRHGALGPLGEAVFTYNAVYSDVIGQGGSWVGLALGLIGGLGRGVPVAAAAGLIGLAVLARRRRLEAIWLGAWIVATLVAVAAQRQLAGYHFLLIVPGLAIAAGLGGAETLRGLGARGRTRLAAAAAAVLLAGLALLQAAAWARAYGGDWSYRRGEVSREVHLRSFDRGAFSPAAEEAAARVVQDASSERQRLLVWGLSPGIYFLARRPPATVYPLHHLLLTDSPLSTRFAGLEARRARFLRGLAEDPPAVILVGTADRNAFEPEDSDRQMVRFAELRQFVARRYAEARPVARFRVFVLRPEDAADDPATGVGQAPREPNPQEALEASASPASRWGSGRR